MALQIRNLEVRLGGFELRVPELAIGPGEILSIVGPSGSGKSTLLLALSGFVPVIGGHILGEQGKSLETLAPESRGVGIVFQKPALLPHLTIRQNVELGLRARGVSSSARKEMAAVVMGSLGIGDLSDRRPDQVSGGQAQRAMLARVFVLNLPVLLLDEPFAALDPPLRRELRALVREQVRQRQVSCVLVTHDPRDAAELSDRVAVLENGALAFSGTVDGARVESAWFRSFLD
ncbi:MAG: ATP-binding cassette domain-containing protein [Deltaproteobacteria bacterium]|nr:ATP-binding cassette domain-containing protein [Deltaproteobacteria bacterium]MBI3294729.1 ATP-binding cassette domain-containing protein [Deltaproteobacteria bacterium]